MRRSSNALALYLVGVFLAACAGSGAGETLSTAWLWIRRACAVVATKDGGTADRDAGAP